LAQHFVSMDRLSQAPPEAIQAIPALGETISASVIAFFGNKQNLKVLEKLKDFGLNMRTEKSAENHPGGSLEGKTFVLTGTLEGFTRGAAEKEILERGGRVSSQVSQKTHAVIAGSKAGSKLQEAQKLGVQILSEADFKKILKKG